MTAALTTTATTQPFNKEHIKLLFKESSDCGITVRNLSIEAKKKTILTVDELQFPKKGVVAIMGPSGSGKSTFLKALSELMDENLTSRGDIEITCIDTNDECNSLCAHFAMVWQKPTVFPCSIYDNLKIPLRKRNVPRKQWLDLMKQALLDVGLLGELDEQWWKQRAQRLSGGQQQRLSIAMGLLKDSPIFLFDEPTSALDPVSTEIIEKIIKNLGRSKLVLLVTHSLGQARRVSDYCAMFHIDEDRGTLCEFSATDEFFNNPASPQSREFIMMETGL